MIPIAADLRMAVRNLLRNTKRSAVALPTAYLLPKDNAWRQQIGVAIAPRAMTSRLSLNGLVSLGDTTISFLGEGIDTVGEQPVSSRINLMAGRMNIVDALRYSQ